MACQFVWLMVINNNTSKLSNILVCEVEKVISSASKDYPQHFSPKSAVSERYPSVFAAAAPYHRLYEVLSMTQMTTLENNTFQQVSSFVTIHIDYLPFPQLKPVCIELSRNAIHHLKEPEIARSSLNETLRCLRKLLSVLGALNARLADYVFFPLAHVFRDIKQLTPVTIDLSVQCLESLIIRGWPCPLNFGLFHQLLLLLCRTLSREHGEFRSHDSLCSVLSCVSSLFELSGESTRYAQAELKGVIGQILDTTLTFLTTLFVRSVQRAASRAVLAILEKLDDPEILDGFLPGVISRLAVLLSFRMQTGIPFEVLVNSINGIWQLLKKSNTGLKRGLPDGLQSTQPNKSHQPLCKTTASNVNLVVRRISHLRYHERDETVDALFMLCKTILEDCRSTLEDAQGTALETVIGVCSRDDLPGTKRRVSQLISLFRNNQELLDRLAHCAHVNVLKLPKLARIASEVSRDRLTAQVRSAFNVLLEVGHDMAELEQLMLQAVLDTLACSLPSMGPLASEVHDDPIEPSISGTTEEYRTAFDLLSSPRAQGNIFLQMRNLLASTVTPRRPAILKMFLQDCLKGLPQSQKTALLWCVSRTVEELYERSLTGQDGPSSLSLPYSCPDLSEACYEHVLDMLCADTDPECQDWKLRALALEVVAFHAQQIREDFRSELSDILFPIIRASASGNSLLSEHASRCLRIVSRSCGYSGPTETLLQNADYLINAASFRLSMLDLSPETPQVIAFLIFQGGPALIPYFHDIVESLFSALASFHGYPRLVQQIFFVFSTIMEQAGLTGQQKPKVPPSRCHPTQGPVDIDALPDVLERTHSHRSETTEAFELKTGQATQCFHVGSNTPSDNCYEQQMDSLDHECKYPVLNSILISIARLGQHFMRHASPEIRRQVLVLLQKACVLLSRDETEFLPLVNDIWPAMVCCMYDPEEMVSVPAMQALAIVIRCAGDFMLSRVEDQWSRITQLYKKTLMEREASQQGHGHRGNFSQAYRKHTAVVDFLLSLTTSVRMNPAMEDEIFELLVPLAREKPGLRGSLQEVNADKTWLALEAPHFRMRPPFCANYQFRTVQLNPSTQLPT